MTPLLQVERLSRRFGGLTAVRDLSFTIARGEIVGLIGPNGAGKTTAFNAISGAIRPSGGRVRFGGRDITGRRPSAIVAAGLVRTFQSTTTFVADTVTRNVENALLTRMRGSLPQRLMGRGAGLLAPDEVALEVDRVLNLVELRPWRDAVAGTLAYGLQKRLGIAIALAARPSMLLLDEPAAGLNHEECNELTRLLRRLRGDLGITVLLVEHHMAVVMDVCERIVVLVQGEKIAEGTPAEVRANAAVVEAYLGAPEHVHA